MHDKLTARDIARLEEEIEYRKLTVRPAAIAAVKEAREQGDLSENFEYYAAKREKNKNESRIRYLERMVRTARVIEDTAAPDEVGLNDSVRIYIEDEDEEETYKIVTTIRENSLEGRISNESPMGKALLGQHVGDRVFIAVVNGGYYVEIKEIIKNNDEDADRIRGF